MQSEPRRPIGRITAALTLITVGGLFLASTLDLLPNASLLLRLWPLLLISLGGEILVARYQGARTRFDWGGMILLLIFLTILSSGAIATQVISNGGFPGRLLFPGSSQTAHAAHYDVTPTLKRVRLVSHAGSVDLLAGTAPEVAVQANMWGAPRGSASPRVDLVEDDETLLIQLNVGDWSNLSAHYRVTLPPGLTVEVESGSGRITASGIKGELHLQNHSGTISVEGSEGPATLTAQSGLVTVTDHAGPVKIEAHSGAIRLQNVTGAVDAQTQSGIITLSLKPGVGAQVEAKSEAGFIRGPAWLQIANQGAKRSASGRVGDGQAQIRLSTHSGAITVD